MAITNRQYKILEYIRKKGAVSNRDVSLLFSTISRATVVRDLNALVRGGFVQKTGKGRSVRYDEKIIHNFLRYIDIEAYFQNEPDKRKARVRFDFDIFGILKTIFTKQELIELQKRTAEYQKRISQMSESVLKKEFERLTIELSWKSSHIEGNTYSLIDTEILIKEHKEADGHKKEEAIMIVNHKNALDYIVAKKRNFYTLRITEILRIHDLLVSGLGVGRGIRKGSVGIVGTRYRPLDNAHQIREALEKTVSEINVQDDVFSKSILTMLLLAYIQPFEDGNKRTSRIVGNAMLLSGNACPLSFRSIDEAEYKKAVILFYEQGNLRYFKELFLEQYYFALENYFLG